MIAGTHVLVGAAILAAGLLHVVPAALGVWAVWGFVLAIMGALEQPVEQGLIPPRSFAQVLASLPSLGMILLSAGSLLGGVLANRIGAGGLCVLIGATDMFTALAMLATRLFARPGSETPRRPPDTVPRRLAGRQVSRCPE
ncbi:MAG: hypothetical protein ACP5QO_01850 [Clostridia bacterium]